MIARDLGLELPRRKPLGIPRINPQHPLARGLTFATLLTGDGVPRDLVLGRAASPSGAPTAIRSTPQGQALLFNGSTDNCNFGDIASYRTGSQNFTVMAYANPPASGTTFGLASKRNGSTFVQVSFAVNMDGNGGPLSGSLGLFMLDGSSNQLSGATTSTPVNGAFHQYVGQRTSGTTLQFYVDALPQTTTYNSTANPNYAGTEPLFVGAMGSTAAPAGGYLPGSIGYLYIWRGRVLTQAEINWLYRDPYAFVREQPRQEPWFTIWVPSAGGGTTYTLSGSTTQPQTLSLRRAPSLVRQIAQTQALVLPRQVRLTRALAQTQTLSIVAQRVFLRTVSLTQVQVLSLSTAVHHTVFLTVSAVQAQVLSLIAHLSMSPPPTPVVVPSSTPAAGVAVSNYLDWPQHTITSSDIPPPVGSAVGGP